MRNFIFNSNTTDYKIKKKKKHITNLGSCALYGKMLHLGLLKRKDVFSYFVEALTNVGPYHCPFLNTAGQS